MARQSCLIDSISTLVLCNRLINSRLQQRRVSVKMAELLLKV